MNDILKTQNSSFMNLTLLFYVFHPAHVLLSALATAAMYKKHAFSKNSPLKNIFFLFLIGYLGAIAVATISDSLMPYLSEVVLKMPNPETHLGFVEKFWLISTMAILGIIIAYFNPNTKFPHSAHVMISTWASLFHVLMALGKSVSAITFLVLFIFLFLAVWVPCCVSDIIFPLLFTPNKDRSCCH